jgi:hypothetical protein
MNIKSVISPINVSFMLALIGLLLAFSGQGLFGLLAALVGMWLGSQGLDTPQRKHALTGIIMNIIIATLIIMSWGMA